MTDTSAVTPAEADRILAQEEGLIPCLQMSLVDGKAMRERLLAAGVPVGLGADQHCTQGCTPKVFILARETDVPRVQDFLQQEWAQMVASVDPDPLAMPLGMSPEAKGEVGAGVGDDDPPCPACGHVGPLDGEGACQGCGLVLG